MSLRFPTTLEGAVPRNRLGFVTDTSKATTRSDDLTHSKSLLSSSVSTTQLKKKRVFSPDYVPPAVVEAQVRLSAAIDTLSGQRQIPSSQSSTRCSNDTKQKNNTSLPRMLGESFRVNDGDTVDDTTSPPPHVAPHQQLTIEELIEESRARISGHNRSNDTAHAGQDAYNPIRHAAISAVKGSRLDGTSTSPTPRNHNHAGPRKLDPIGVAKLQNMSRPKQEKRHQSDTSTNISDHSTPTPQSIFGAGSKSPPIQQQVNIIPITRSSLTETSGKGVVSGALYSFDEAPSHNTSGNVLPVTSLNSLGPLQLQQQLKDVQGQLALSQARIATLEEHQVKVADQLVAAKRELDRKDDAIEDRNREIEESVHIRIALLGRIERLEKTIYELELQAAEPEKRNRELVRINLDLTDKANHFRNALEDTDTMLRTARARVVQLEEEAQLRQLDALQSVSRSEVVSWKAREVELLDSNSRIQSLLVRTQGQLDAAVFRVQKSRETRRGGDAAGGSSTPRPQWGLFGAAFPDAASTVQRIRLAYDVINNYAEETKTLRSQLHKYQQMYVPPTLPQFAGSSDFSVRKGAALSSFNSEGMARAQLLGSEWLMSNRYLPKLGYGAIVPQFLRGTGRATNMFLTESDVIGYCKLAWLELDVSRPPISFDEAVQRMVKKYAPTSTTRRRSSPRLSPRDQSHITSTPPAGASSSSPITRGDFAYSFWYGIHWYGGIQPVVALTRDLVYGSVQEAIIHDLLFDVKKIRNALTAAARKSIAMNLQQNVGSKAATPAQTPQAAHLKPLPFTTSSSIPVKGSALVDKMLVPGGEDDGALLALETAGSTQSLYVPVEEAVSILEAQFPLKSPYDIKQLAEAIRDVAAGKPSKQSRRRDSSGSSSSEKGEEYSDDDRSGEEVYSGSSAVSTPSSMFAHRTRSTATTTNSRKKPTARGSGNNSLPPEHSRNTGGVSLQKLFSFNSTKRTHSVFVDTLHSQYLYTRKLLLYMYVDAINAASQQTASEAVAHMRSGKRGSGVIFDQSLNNKDGGKDEKSGFTIDGDPEVLNVILYKTHAGTPLPMPSTYEQANGGYVTPRTLSHQLWKRDGGIPAQHMDEILGYLFNTKIEYFQPVSQESSSLAASSAAAGREGSVLAGGGGLSHHQGLPGDTLIRVYKCTDVYAEYSSILGRVFSKPLYRFTVSSSEIK